jgi:hypothetical protein
MKQIIADSMVISTDESIDAELRRDLRGDIDTAHKRPR